MEKVNRDELIGYILRKIHDVDDVELTYREVKAVLDAEEAFIHMKAIDDEEKSKTKTTEYFG